MKAYHTVTFVLLFIACQQAPPSSVSSSSSSALPAGAESTPYDDDSGLTLVTSRNAQGGITSQGTFKDGKKQGNWTEYHPNGLVKSITNYHLGLKEGISVILSNTGQLEESISYHLDVRHGDNRTYVRNRIKSESNFVNGKLEGLTSLYYDNGTIMEEGMYKGGIRHGISKWYDQQGNLKFEYEYNEGSLVK